MQLEIVNPHVQLIVSVQHVLCRKNTLDNYSADNSVLIYILASSYFTSKFYAANTITIFYTCS